MDIDLVNLSKTQGFRFAGLQEGYYLGSSVSSAGDFNNDGLDDIVIGASAALALGRGGAGSSYVIFGKNITFFDTVYKDFINTVYIDSINSTQGFKIFGANPGDSLGTSVSGVGDFNGDGIDDVVISALRASPLNRSNAGENYVIFGKKGVAFGNIDLKFFNNTLQGFKIIGANPNDWSGWSVSSAGDFNKDGIDDIIIGAFGAAPLNRTQAGESCVIFGKNNTAFSNIDLANLTNTQGFKIFGANQYDHVTSVSSAGDFNGDAIDDIIIGASNASSLNGEATGLSYVIFGKKAATFNNIDLLTLNTTQGFKILGARSGDSIADSVGGAGDINGDGIDDIIIGAPHASRLGRIEAGESYIIFGKNITIFSDIDLANFTSTQGFKILGACSGDKTGNSVSGAGDINGDGIDDIIIGAPQASPNGRGNAGESYVIFGKNGAAFDNIDLNNSDSSQGFKISGPFSKNNMGSSVCKCDINNDGLTDIMIGGPGNDAGNANPGLSSSYIIYGVKAPLPTPWWMPYLEIGLPVTIAGLILTAGSTYSVYKYKQEGTICGYHVGNADSEQSHLVNQALVDSETWYT